MDRKQKIGRVAQRDGKVFRVTNLRVAEQYLHPDYLVKDHPGGFAIRLHILGDFFTASATCSYGGRLLERHKAQHI